MSILKEKLVKIVSKNFTCIIKVIMHRVSALGFKLVLTLQIMNKELLVTFLDTSTVMKTQALAIFNYVTIIS